MPGNAFAAFNYYHPPTSALQSPLLAGTARYDHAAYMHGNAYPINVAVPQQQPQQQLQGHSSIAGMLPQMYALPQQLPVLHVKPLQSPITTSTSTARPTTASTSTSTSTTTTTTTTTTTPPPPPPPPTTTSTSSTSTSKTTISAPATLNSQTQNASTSLYTPQQPQSQPQPQPYPYPYPYPTYNRRAYMGYNPTHSYRPAYPYPDYTLYKTAPASRFSSHGGQIQFVPCMCPISVSSGAERHTALSPQLRSSSGEEEDLLVLARNDDMSLPAEPSVGTEKLVQGKNETVGGRNGIEVQQVKAKIGHGESEVAQNSTQQLSKETVNVKLSTPKVEEKFYDGVANVSEQAVIVL
ncbi:endochitinase A isoform X2 [Ceratitis capitata]|nr:endochitinase A isoform X2 [Ceratitis capitata]